MNQPVNPKKRCAVYTRKSTEEGLDQEYNSLHAQRDACESYIASQRHQGWVVVPTDYDDGGHSGGTLDRPAMQRLMRDIEAGLIDIVVVYKVDRITRSLMDFGKLVDVFKRHEVLFVSVTQPFNTTSSMGRMNLNVLLTFAEYEREAIAERIRDKFAASRKKGMWMGGMPPLGYAVMDRKLVVIDAEAALVRQIFERFVTLGSGMLVVKELNDGGILTKSWVTQSGVQRKGRLFDKSVIYKILNNRIYLGEAVHKGQSYPGEHKAIIGQTLWDQVHAILAKNAHVRSNRARARTPAPLKGLLRCVACDRAMTPTHTHRRGRTYRYYTCMHSIKAGSGACPVRMIAAGEIETVVLDQVRRLLRAPEIVARTVTAYHDVGERDASAAARERKVIEALGQLDQVWEELFPAEQVRILQLVVERVDVAPDGVDVRLRVAGIHSLVAEMTANENQPGPSPADDNRYAGETAA